jgi:hypothetical protein
MFRGWPNVWRDRLAGFDGTLKNAADTVLRHFAGSLEGFSKRADFQNGRDKTL